MFFFVRVRWVAASIVDAGARTPEVDEEERHRVLQAERLVRRGAGHLALRRLGHGAADAVDCGVPDSRAAQASNLGHSGV